MTLLYSISSYFTHMDHTVWDNLLTQWSTICLLENMPNFSGEIQSRHKYSQFCFSKNIESFYYLYWYKRKPNLNRILTFDFSKTAKRLIQTGYRRLCEGSKTIEFCQKRDLLDWHCPYLNNYSEFKPFNQNLCLSINQSKARLRNRHVIDKDTRHRISKN